MTAHQATGPFLPPYWARPMLYTWMEATPYYLFPNLLGFGP